MAILADGAPAPSFTVHDLDGKEIDLYDVLTLYPVLLVFFRSDCELCAWALPQLARYEATFKGGSIEVYYVTSDHPHVAAATLRALRLEDLHVVTDPGGDVAVAYGVEQLPAAVLIYPDRTVAAGVEGWQPDEFTLIGAMIKDLILWIRGPQFGASWHGEPCPARG